MKPLVFNKLRFLPLICLVFGIICLILSTTVFSSKTIQLTKTSFPKYGSPEQGSSNGWVQLKAIKMEYLGYTESDSLVKYKNGRIDSNYTKNFLYFVTDDERHELVYMDRAGISNRYIQKLYLDNQISEDDLPMQLYGHLGNVSIYSSYDGYQEWLNQYEKYDLITEMLYDAEATITEQSDLYKTLENICSKLSMILIIGSFVLSVILKKIMPKVVKQSNVE